MSDQIEHEPISKPHHTHDDAALRDAMNRVRLEVGGMCLYPLGGPQQRGFFTVPCGVDNGPLRRPALLAHFAKRPRLFQFC